MKRFLVLACMTSVSGIASASLAGRAFPLREPEMVLQEEPPSPPPTPPTGDNKLQLAGGQDPRQMSSGLGKLIVGAILSGIGTIAVVAAVDALIQALTDKCPLGGGISMAIAVIIGIPGVVLLGVGLVLLILGVNQYTQYKTAMKEAGLSLRAVPGSKSAALVASWRF